jgi:hypothetical protein
VLLEDGGEVRFGHVVGEGAIAEDHRRVAGRSEILAGVVGRVDVDQLTAPGCRQARNSSIARWSPLFGMSFI